MSDTAEGFELSSTEADPGTGTPAGAEPTTETQKEYFNLDEVADRYVKLTVDGEEIEVPLQELRQGYSRTADYTRKTQELAAQREQAQYALTLQRALEANPEETIKLLAGRYGLSFGEQQALREHMQPDPFEGIDDPLERKVTALERQLQERDARDQQAAADLALQRAIGGLQNQYHADDAMVREVVATALQMQAGPEAFEMIYKNIMFDRAAEARRTALETRQREDQQRQAAAQRAQETTGAGASAAGAGAPPPQQTKFKTYREAIEATYDELAAGGR